MSRVTRRQALAGTAAVGTAAVLGGAAAAQAQQKPKHNTEPPVISKAKPEDHGPREVFAVVDADGNLKRGLFVESVRRLGLGFYEVVFKRDVRRGCYQATLGGHGYEGLPPIGFVSVMGRATDPKAVVVTTANAQGTPFAAGFHLLVVCPEGFA